MELTGTKERESREKEGKGEEMSAEKETVQGAAQSLQTSKALH